MSYGNLLARGGGRVLVLLTFGGWGGVVQNRESPDFRSPEVGRYGLLAADRFCKKDENLFCFFP